jgi:hypothetical protein
MRYYHAIILFLLCSCQHLNKHHDVIIANVNIINVSTGEVKRNRWVFIDEERITAIGEGVDGHQADTIVDGTDKYLIPGLWDMHAHEYLYYTNLSVANGIVGVRDMFGNMKNLSEVRQRKIGKHSIVPEVYSSGTIVDGPGPDSSDSDIVNTRRDVIKVLSRQKAEGVDFIKILNQLSPEVYRAIAHCADSLDIPFAGHVPFKVSIWEAIRSNQRSIEHSLGILEASSTKADSLLAYFNSTEETFASWNTDVFDLLIKTFDERRFDSLTKVLASHDVYLSPTLVAARGWSHRYDTAFYNDNRMKYIHPDGRAYWKTARDSEEIAAYKRKYEFERKLMGRLRKAGVKFLAATDAPSFYTYPGFDLHTELQFFVDDGFPSLEALQTATLNPAVFTGKANDYGTVEANKYASLVLLNSNPLENITNTKDINSVFLKGYYLSRHSLDSLMKVQETAYYYRN